MAKEIKLLESSLKRLILNEVVGQIPMNGDKTLEQFLKTLNSIPNLHTDKYENKEVSDAYRTWEDTGFSKDGVEYDAWSNVLKSFLKYLDRSVDYIVNRMTLGLTDKFFIDPMWVSHVRAGENEYECFYTLVLKIYQNPSIWNDLFFNPMFSGTSKPLLNVMDAVTNVKNDDTTGMDAMTVWSRRKMLLPKEFWTLNKYRKDESNMKEDLFCEPDIDYNEFL